jgi:hypothetical protein
MADETSVLWHLPSAICPLMFDVVSRGVTRSGYHAMP